MVDKHSVSGAAHTCPVGGVSPWPAAFGEHPGAAVRVLPSDPPARRWAAAVALGAQGHYAAAATLLEPLTRPGAAPPEIRAHAAVTRAAHLRQAGGHLAARRWDGLGLALAAAPTTATATDRPPARVTTTRSPDPGSPDPGSPDPGMPDPGMPDPGVDGAAARIDALLGLAADALGLGDLDAADRLLDRAGPAVSAHPSWRPRVRRLWVTAELALCRDRPGPAAELAAEARELAGRAGATRHLIKSTLLWTVARVGAGEPAVGLVAELSALTVQTRTCGLTTLEWPSLWQLATLRSTNQLDRATDDRRATFRALAVVRRQADPVTRKVMNGSPWVPFPSAAELLHMDASHPPETCRSPQCPRMECRISP